MRDSGFSPEDAIILASGSFGLARDLSNIGVEAIVTADFKLAANYQGSYTEIERRFKEMVNALAGTYKVEPAASIDIYRGTGKVLIVR